MKRTISAMEARKRFGELLEDVSRGDEVVIERAGKPMGVVVPAHRYRALLAERDGLAELLRKLDESDARFSDKELVAAIEALRKAQSRERILAFMARSSEATKAIPEEELEELIEQAVQEARELVKRGEA